jgi:hypothetical protein
MHVSKHAPATEDIRITGYVAERHTWAISRKLLSCGGSHETIGGMDKARYIWAIAAGVAILASLGVGLWLGGGPSTREGWEAASWAAAVTAALGMAATAIGRAATAPSSSEKNSDPLEAAEENSSESIPVEEREVYEQRFPGAVHTSLREDREGRQRDIDHYLSLAAVHRRNIRILERQVAAFGPLHTPPHKQVELEEERERLRNLREIITEVNDE